MEVIEAKRKNPKPSRTRVRKPRRIYDDEIPDTRPSEDEREIIIGPGNEESK